MHMFSTMYMLIKNTDIYIVTDNNTAAMMYI